MASLRKTRKKWGKGRSVLLIRPIYLIHVSYNSSFLLSESIEQNNFPKFHETCVSFCSRNNFTLYFLGPFPGCPSFPLQIWIVHLYIVFVVLEPLWNHPLQAWCILIQSHLPSDSVCVHQWVFKFSKPAFSTF